MSITRTVALKSIDKSIMEEAAEECGFEVDHNRKFNLYGGRKSACEAALIVRAKGSNMEIGFIRNGDEYEISYDHLEGDTYGKLMSSYFEKLVSKRSRGRYRLVNKQDSRDKVTLTLRRAY